MRACRHLHYLSTPATREVRSRAPASVLFSSWLRELHKATYKRSTSCDVRKSSTTASDDQSAASFSILPLSALRRVGQAVVDEAANTRVHQLVEWTLQPHTASATTAITPTEPVVPAEEGRHHPSRQEGVCWGLPEEVVGTRTSSSSTAAATTTEEHDCGVDSALAHDLDYFLIVWAVQVVVARWRLDSADTCPAGELIDRWQRALDEDVRPVVDFFWMPSWTHTVGQSATHLPAPPLSVHRIDTARVCYIWSSILFVSFCQLVPFAESHTPDWFQATRSIWDANIRQSLEVLLAQAHHVTRTAPAATTTTTQTFYSERIQAQMHTVERLLARHRAPSHAPVVPSEPHRSPLLDFVTSLFSQAAARGPACEPTSVAPSLSACAPLWPCPVSPARFRTAMVDVQQDTYQSVYSALAQRCDADARAREDPSVLADGDDADVIARVHQQLSNIARHGGNTPMV